MRKLLLVAILVLILCGQAVAGDSLLVAIRNAKNNIGVTNVSDSVWNAWANSAYQWVLTTGYALVRDTTYLVKPYAFPDSIKYVHPSDHYEWIGMTVVSNASRKKRNLQLVIPGQEHELGLCEGTGDICFAIPTQDSVRFWPNPSRYDTVLYTYYSKDQNLVDTDVMAIDEVYTTIISHYILAEYYLRMQNGEMNSYCRQLGEAELNKITQMRRKIKADYVIPTKISEK